MFQNCGPRENKKKYENTLCVNPLPSEAKMLLKYIRAMALKWFDIW